MANLGSIAQAALGDQGATDWGAKVEQIAGEEGLDPKIARQLANFESGLNPKAVSKAGAIGVMQVMPATGHSLGFDVNDPLQNIRAGVRYFKQKMDAFHGDPRLAYAHGYNPGYTGRGPFGDAQDTSDWTLNKSGAQKPGDPSQVPSTAGWILHTSSPQPQKGAVKPSQAPAPTPTPKWWEEQPGRAPTLQGIVQNLTQGFERLTGRGNQPLPQNVVLPGSPLAKLGITPELGSQIGSVGLGALQIAGAPFQAADQFIKSKIVNQGQTYAQALTEYYHVPPPIAKPIGIALDMLSPSMVVGGAAVKGISALGRAGEIGLKTAPLETRAAQVADHLAPTTDVNATRAQAITKAILDSAGHPSVPVLKPDIPITEAHAKPVTTPPGPLTDSIRAVPYQTLAESIPDPLLRTHLAGDNPASVLGPIVEQVRDIKAGMGQLEKQDTQGIMQSMTQQLLSDERLMKFRELGRQYREGGPVSEAVTAEERAGAVHGGVEGTPQPQGWLEKLFPGGAERGSISPAKRDPALTNAMGQAVLGGMKSWGKNMKGALGDAVRGLAISGDNAVKGMGPIGQRIVQIVNDAHDAAQIRAGHVSYAIKTVARGMSEDDWKAVQAHVDTELRTHQQDLPLGETAHPDIAALPTLTSKQQVLKNAVVTYYQKTIADIMKANAIDYAPAQEKMWGYMQEGAKEGTRLPPSKEFLNAVEHAERNLAFTESFGVGNSKTQPLLDAITGQSKADGQFAKQWYQLKTGSMYEADRVSSDLVNKIVSATVAAKLPLAVLRHAGQIINAAAIVDTNSFVKHMMKIFTGARDLGDQGFIERAGIVSQEIMQEFRRLETGTGLETWGSDVLRKTGLTGMRQRNLTIAGLMGREAFNSAVKRLDNPRNVEFLQQVGFSSQDIDRLRAGGMTELDQIKTSRYVANASMFKGGPGDLPLIVSSNPWVRIGFLLKGFHFKQMSLLRDAIWTHGLQDMAKHGPTVNNMRPLIAFGALAWPVGEMAKTAQIAAMYAGGGFTSGDNFWDFYNKRTPPAALDRWIDRIAFVGSLGMLDTVRQALIHPTRDPSRLTGMLYGPDLGQGVAAEQGALDALRGKMSGVEKLAETGAGYVPGAGLFLPQMIHNLFGPGKKQQGEVR